jgi:hypothetical protein
MPMVDIAAAPSLLVAARPTSSAIESTERRTESPQKGGRAKIRPLRQLLWSKVLRGRCLRQRTKNRNDSKWTRQAAGNIFLVSYGSQFVKAPVDDLLLKMGQTMIDRLRVKGKVRTHAHGRPTNVRMIHKLPSLSLCRQRRQRQQEFQEGRCGYRSTNCHRKTAGPALSSFRHHGIVPATAALVLLVLKAATTPP